jgi:transcriptional regulator with XRE-family HTH domain
MRRRLFGKRLKALREANGFTTLDAARAIGHETEDTYEHFEAGRRVPKYDTLDVLSRRIYDLDDKALAAFQTERAAASERSRWAKFGYPANATTYLGLEDDAAELRTVEHVVMPGMLQTECYMRRRLERGRPLTPETVRKRVTARLLRQERLTATEDPLQLVAVISEAALRWCAHEPEVGVLQLEHLVDLGQRDNVKIRILPFSVGLHPGMDGAFSVLHFPVIPVDDGEPDHASLLPPVLYVESVIGGNLIEDAPTVTRLDTLFGELRDQALDPNDSLDWITQLAEQHANNNDREIDGTA